MIGGRKMRKIAAITIMVVMMLPVLSILPVDNTKAENVKTESAPMPTWNVGDMWNYSVSMFSGDVTGALMQV